MSDDRHPIVHTIRLRGPWTFQLVSAGELDASGADPADARTFPAPDGLAGRIPSDFRGRVVVERFFHRPTGLEHDTQVRLVVQSPVAFRVALNDGDFAASAGDSISLLVTERLQVRNRLRVELVIDEPDRIRQLSCEARLEILQPDIS